MEDNRWVVVLTLFIGCGLVWGCTSSKNVKIEKSCAEFSDIKREHHSSKPKLQLSAKRILASVDRPGSKNLCPKSNSEKEKSQKLLQEKGYEFNLSNFIKQLKNKNRNIINKFWQAGISQKKGILSKIIRDSNLSTDVKIQVISQAIKCGANVNDGTSLYRHPLTFAITEQQSNIALLLIKNGAEIDPEQLPSPLIMAVNKNMDTVARVLIKKGANVHRSEDRPLREAVKNNNTELARVLIKNGANVNAKESSSGWTPLHFAALHATSEGDPELVRLLIKNGADVNAKGQLGSTPINKAAISGDVEITCVLLKNGAHINSVGFDGSTPLQKAEKKSHHSKRHKKLYHFLKDI